MGRKQPPGLRQRSGIWHIEKQIGGRRIFCSTGARRLEEAEAVLARVIEDERQARLFGVRPNRTFEEAAAKFVIEHQHKTSLKSDVQRLQNLMPFIGLVTLRQLHMGPLQDWIASRRDDRVSAGTINHGLQVVRRILNLAATEWVDENGLSWLQQAPKIKLLANRSKRQPYPLSWIEQERLFAELPSHLQQMALFKVNTGLRDSDVCGLMWDDEVDVPELGTSVFLIPAERVKDTDGKRSDDRIVILNSLAKKVIKHQRGQHPSHVFHFDGRPITRIGNTAWYGARERAELPEVRVHDLKHTFGRRLRAAGVSYEDRQDLLGHRSNRMTTHYSAGELNNLIAMAEKVVKSNDAESVPLIVLKRRSMKKSGKTSANGLPSTSAEASNPLETLVAEEGLEPPTRGL